MKYPSKQSADRATDWIYKDFKLARRKLVAIYMAIILGVVLLFSFILIKEVKNPVEQKSISTDQSVVLSVDEALTKAKALMPDKKIAETEYEFEDGALIFAMGYESGEEVKANFFTGRVYIETEEEESWVQKITDDFDEMVLWIALLVFLIASLAAVYVANNTLKPISKSIKKQKEFVSAAAHELRNPLAAIHTSIEAAQRLPETQMKNTMEDLLSETKRLIKTSESLLDIEHNESRARNISAQNFGGALDEVLGRLQASFEKKNISVLKDISGSPIMIDREDLVTILYNLIHNAIKFSEKESQITVAWSGDTITVSDSGIGMAPEHLDRIFERFYKADSGRGFENGGNGLGLSLIHDIVNYYNASIVVKSEIQKGTTFSIKF